MKQTIAKTFYWPFQAGASFVDTCFVILVLVCLQYCPFCSLQPCSYLLGKVWHIVTCFLFVWFDSLRPINNLSVIKGRVFLGWTSTKLGLMFLLKDTTQWRRWGSNPRPFGLESSTLPLSHCAPLTSTWEVVFVTFPYGVLGRCGIWLYQLLIFALFLFLQLKSRIV